MKASSRFYFHLCVKFTLKKGHLWNVDASRKKMRNEKGIFSPFGKERCIHVASDQSWEMCRQKGTKVHGEVMDRPMKAVGKTDSQWDLMRVQIDRTFNYKLLHIILSTQRSCSC